MQNKVAVDNAQHNPTMDISANFNHAMRAKHIPWHVLDIKNTPSIVMGLAANIPKTFSNFLKHFSKLFTRKASMCQLCITFNLTFVFI